MKIIAPYISLISILKNSPTFIVMVICCFLLLESSCVNKEAKTQSTQKAGLLVKEKVQSSLNANCLEKYYGKPEELLTLELVNNYIDFKGADVDIAKISDQIIRDKNFAQVNCKWKIKNQRRIIRLKQISKIQLYESKSPIERFYDKYHTRTPEEQELLSKKFDSLVLNNDKVKNKTNQSTAKMVSESIGFDFKYINIDNIGDAAVWEYQVNDLIVLVSNYQFTLNVDLENGNDYDLDRAKLIASAIIDKACH